MAKRRKQYEVNANDDHHVYSTMLSTHSEGHTLLAFVDSEKEALLLYKTWLAAHPPLGKKARAAVFEVLSRGGRFTVVSAAADGGTWKES